MSLKSVVENYDKTNIAKGMDQDKLDLIGDKVVRDFEIDWNSCSEWREQNEEALKLAKQVKEAKNFPWPGAASVKWPAITTAALQFAARAYPEIVQQGGVARAKVVGKDPDKEKAKRADRVSKHMSWQLSDQMTEWEEETDRLLHVLPIIGEVYRKTYFCPSEQRNFSILCLPDDVVVNRRVRSLETARRISHRIYKYENDIYENVESGLWLDEELGQPQMEDGDEDTPHEFIEQHRFEDLDEDGYAEPYIVTVHSDTRKVVRILARYQLENIKYRKEKVTRIKPDLYFTKYGFIPNPDGSFLYIGFGSLLTPINEAINATLNQMLDCATLYNTSGGFIGRGIRIKGGRMLFEPNEWKVVETLGTDLKNQVVPLPVREPSQTSYLLLTLLIDAAKDVSSVKDVLTGEKPGENVSVETVLAIVEQGLKVFTGIYKRIYHALRKELRRLFDLNALYMEPEEYFRVLDEEEARTAYQTDYNIKDCDVYPVADPQMSLDVLRLTRAQALMQMLGQPGINDDQIREHYLEAIKVDKDRFWIPPDKREPTPNPEMEKLYFEMDLEKQKFRLESMETLQKMRESVSKTMLNLAKAESEEMGPQIEQLRIKAQQIGDILEFEQKKLEIKDRERDRSGRVEKAPGNKGSN